MKTIRDRHRTSILCAFTLAAVAAAWWGLAPAEAAPPPTLATQKIDDLGLIAFSTRGMKADENDRAIMDFTRTCGCKSYLLIEGLNGVSSIGRKAMLDEVTRARGSMAVLTDSKQVQGLVTAGSWVGLSAKAFARARVRDALAYLKVPPASQAKIEAEVKRLSAVVQLR